MNFLLCALYIAAILEAGRLIYKFITFQMDCFDWCDKLVICLSLAALILSAVKNILHILPLK